MSFARAFSTRRNKSEAVIGSFLHVGRAASQRGGRPVLRTQISSPMALVSTSNMQIHDAQDIAGAVPIKIRDASYSSAASVSGDDSDGSTVHSGGETVTDASSVDESSPISAQPEPNHLSCYFKPAIDTHTRSRSPSESPSASVRASLDSPSIPQRVPSHSKKAHENVHRKRSLQRIMSPAPAARQAVRSSVGMFSVGGDTTSATSFGNDLTQVVEVAEDFGSGPLEYDNEAEVDALVMESHGLAHFTASDYMLEIQSLVSDVFGSTLDGEWI